MVKCPFCGHDNEDGALYCEMCQTDLSIPAPLPNSKSGDSANVLDLSQDSAPTINLLPVTPLPENPPPISLGLDEKTPSIPFEPVTRIPSSAPTASGTGPTLVGGNSASGSQTVSGSQTASGSSTSSAGPTMSAANTSNPLGSDTLNLLAPQIGSAPTVPSGPTGDVTTAVLKPKLLVLRGEKIDMQYPIYPGKNYLGRTDEKPVDIDLENQEPADRIWTSRQHALITYENGQLTIEDLNSLNGTFVNRTRVHPGQVRTIQVNDVVQVGTVQMKVVFS